MVRLRVNEYNLNACDRDDTKAHSGGERLLDVPDFLGPILITFYESLSSLSAIDEARRDAQALPM
jgi:hypothetical protein